VGNHRGRDGGRRHRFVASAVAGLLTLAVLIGVTACGGGDGDAEAAGTTTSTNSLGVDETALTRAASEFNRAQIDAAASAEDAATIHRLLVADCRAQWTVDQVQGLLVDWVDQRRVEMGAVAEDLRVGQLRLDDIHRDYADVLVTYVAPDDADPTGWGAPVRQTWVLEEGEWRYDLCNEIGRVDGSTDVYTPVRVVASGMHDIPGDDDGRYATNWGVVVANPNSDGIAYDVVVTIRFFDAQGEQLDKLESTIIDIEAGQLGAVADTADAKGAVRMEATARADSWGVSDGWTSALTGAYEGSRVEEPTQPGLAATTYLSGTVTNGTDQELGAGPVAVFVDGIGRVVGGTDFALIPGAVAPNGGTVRFSMTYPGVLPADWTVKIYVTPRAPDHSSDDLIGGLLDELEPTTGS
jgi:hypothetical protein